VWSVKQENDEQLDELTVHLATDVGLLAVIAPGGLAGRQDGYSWWTDEDLLLAEANAGHIIPIETGEEGGFAVRVTFDELDERERRLAAQSALFWLHVADDGEVAVVSGEELSFPDTSGAATFWAEPGAYTATVTRLRWTEAADDDTEDALPDYVVRLQPCEPGDEAPELDYIPDLSISDE